MKQSKLMSLIESVTSIAVGFGISLGCQIVFLPMLGVSINLGQNIVFALIMTVISICRQYVMRRIFEALHIRIPMSASAAAILSERSRQQSQEGWSAEHDANHLPGDLASAGAAYALAAAHQSAGDRVHRPVFWPWSKTWWKPQDARRNLIKAGALILAELDRSDYERKNKRAA